MVFNQEISTYFQSSSLMKYSQKIVENFEIAANLKQT